MNRMNHDQERLPISVHNASKRVALVPRRYMFALLSLIFSFVAFAPTPVHAQGGVQQLFIPLVAEPPVVLPFAFLGSNDCGDENFTDRAFGTGTYTYGIEQLLWAVRIEQSIGASYNIEFTIDGVVNPGLARTGVVDESQYDVFGTLVFGTGGACGGELPRGQYTIRLYMNGGLQNEGTAIIQ